MSAALPALSFVAPSGTGKTTLLEAVIEELVARAHRVVVLKASHHDHDLDIEGKDSWRFSQAGAVCVGLVGPARSTLFVQTGREAWPGAEAMRAWFQCSPLFVPDLLLCEGFSEDPALPKLRVVRGDWVQCEASEDLVAIAWDGLDRPPELDSSVPVLPLDGAKVADWIEAWAGLGVRR